MRVVHLNNADTKGGAARAGLALNKALRKAGINSNILVQTKYSDDKFVSTINNSIFNSAFTLARKGLDFLTIQFFTLKERGRFSFPVFGKNITDYGIVKDADIIHLHWINEGFFSLNSLRSLVKLKKPIVWTLHDMWAFTGGCHYDSGCGNFTSRCDTCPSLRFRGERDFSSTIFARKINLYKSFHPYFVTCSSWLAETAKQSILLRDKSIKSIPNPINVNVFTPLDKIKIKKKLNLSPEKFHILFATMTVSEERKGFEYLKKSLIHLHKNNKALNDKIELIVMGAVNASLESQLPYKTKFVGRLSDDKSIVECYNSADIFVAPSLQDNLPNTVMEALACGVPVVAFNLGGIPEMVAHKMNGYLAEEKSVEDLAEGIRYFYLNKDNLEGFNNSAREIVLDSFTEEIVAGKYIELYKSLI